MFDQGGNRRKGQFRVEIHAHLGKLHAYIGIQLALLDGVKQAVIHIGRLLRLLGRMHVFSQAIEGGRHPMAVHCRGRGQYFFDTPAGYEARRHPPAKSRILGEVA